MWITDISNYYKCFLNPVNYQHHYSERNKYSIAIYLVTKYENIIFVVPRSMRHLFIYAIGYIKCTIDNANRRQHILEFVISPCVAFKLCDLNKRE